MFATTRIQPKFYKYTETKKKENIFIHEAIGLTIKTTQPLNAKNAKIVVQRVATSMHYDIFRSYVFLGFFVSLFIVSI